MAGRDPLRSAPMELPPGPRLPPILQTMQIMKDPRGFAERNRERFGEPFTVRMGGAGPAVYVTDPALIEQVFKASPDVLHAGSGNRLLAPFVGPASVLTSDGVAHRNRRKLLTPPFHGERMRAYADVVVDATKQATANWRGEVAVLPAFEELALDVIVRAIYGLAEDSAAAQKAAIQGAIEAMTPGVVFFSWLRTDWGAWSPWGKYLRASAHADGLLQAEVDRRRATPDPGASDVLTMLLETADEAGEPLSDGELRDHMVTLLAAGHLTTAVGLSWLVLEVFRRPDLVERLRAEVAAAEDVQAIARNPWITAVVKESLRLHPPVAATLREVVKPFALGDRTLPPGTRITVALTATQRDPAHWPDPDAFLPDRWLAGKPPPYAWLPFGGGTRRCLGEAMAMFELKIALATLAELPIVAPPDLPPMKRRNLSLAPARGGRVRVG